MPSAALEQPSTGRSAIIADLQARKSVLPKGGTYAKISDAVIAQSAGAAEAELRVARLKSEAKSKNWLPSIGPSVSLTSLGGTVAELLIDQPVFDRGRRKAERAYAAADVEVAAVGLSTAMNQRVYDGLKDYVDAERARAQAAVAQSAAAKLQEFGAIMQKRVAGGLSDGSDQQVLDQHIAEMQATSAGDQQAEAAAMAQLQALTGQAMSGASGLDKLADGSKAEPLSVVKARGEGARTIAQAAGEAAGLKLGITASAGLSENGVNPGVRLNPGGFLNPGNKQNIEALQQTADVVDRQTAEVAETANRRIVELQSQRSTYATRQAQSAGVLSKTEGNLELFNMQYKSGRMSLLDLVGQYDSFARMKRDYVSLQYDMALIDLEIARDRGLLVDGARM